MRHAESDDHAALSLAPEPRDETIAAADANPRTARTGVGPAPEVASAADGTPGPARRRRPAWLLPTLLVLCAGLGFAGWRYADPVMAALGLSPAPTAQPAARDGATDAPADADAVTLDAEGRKRLGLGFGRAEIRRIVRSVNGPGMVAFDERRVTHLKPRTQGRVLSLSVQPGDRVEAGQTLATLDASSVLDARNGLAGARAGLGEAQATETVAETNLKRGIALLKFGGIAEAEVDRRRVERAKAQAAVQSAQSQVETFKAQYERLAPTADLASGTSAIVSPIGGVVTRADITLGEVVDTSRDAFTVADPSRILVLANLYGQDIDAVRAGAPALVTAPVSSHPRFEGRVSSVNAALDPATNTAPARIEMANPDDLLRANMFVTVAIQADLGRDGTTIPASAVQQTEGGPIAFVRTADDRFEKRDLRLGLQRADWVEVTAGLSEGETVATTGSFGLKAILLRSLLGATD
ncbi:efflux RND transporter periplasmic adaptor subunit [Methylobacterium sp. BTF04]|uniref:efflux RND transporter periplasmic adaptor subunit n=1 Tax=Methylobacterium sp. BTF04 TaxID=2708300 RepID=UPI0013D59340|nr:efflux RND transporter periplasmic adaptor subunit [Methylobacterium sp. BTF04]NEU12721.1 efflux RND transporter periplasmic adaptor subunit [Methylobacterium sp. BTF04]